jgi:hypothetical protein
MQKGKQKLTLDGPAIYEITVPGELDESWTEWDGRMTLRVECEGDSPPVSILTGTLDQAALHGLLRRLYALGLPLISVVFLECGSTEIDLHHANR